MGASCLLPAFALLLGLQGAARAAVAQQHQQQDEEVVVCEGHVRLSPQHADALGPVDLTAASVRLVTDGGTVKDTQFCSPSGYYLLPLDEETAGRPFFLQVVGPPEWLFEEALRVLPEGRCTGDINFTITGFAVAGEVLSYASGEGVEGIPLLLQPAAGEAAAAGAGVTGVTRRDGFFALATPGNGIKTLSLGDTGGASWALSPPQQQIKIYGGGKVMPPRVTFKLVAAGLHGKGPSGLGLSTAAVLLLPSECPALSSPNCGAPPLDAAAAAALLSPDALAAAAPEELHSLLKGGQEGSLCATELDEKTGVFAFPLAPLCSSTLLLSPFGLQHHQQHKQQETIALHFSPQVQRVEVTGGRLAVSAIKLVGVARRGRVVARGKTEVPVAAAKVLLNGAYSGVQTAQDGTFFLPYVPLGPFSITAEKEGMIFETVQLENVSPSSASLPPIHVLSVSVCGVLLPGVEAQVLGADDSRILKGDSNGKVCFHAAPHSEVSVQLQGGGLSPSVRRLHVGGDAIPNAQLMQLIYKLRGTIICSSSGSSGREALKALCSPQHLLLRLKPSGAAKEAQDIALEVQQQQQQQQVTLTFSVESLAEGTYTLDLTERTKGEAASRICWRRQSLKVSLPPKGGEEGVEDDGDGVVSVSFSSVGFAIAGRSSDAMLVAVSPVPEETKEDAASLSYRIPEGQFSLCVPCLGCTYTLNPPTWLRVETRPQTFAAAAAARGDTVHFTVQSVARRVAAVVSVSLPPQGSPGAPKGLPHDMKVQIAAKLLRGDREAPGPFPCTYTRTENAAAAAGVAVFECDLWLPGAAQLTVEAFSLAGLPLLLAHQHVEYPQQQQRQQQQEGTVLVLPIQKAETEPQGPSLQLDVEIGCSLEGQIQPPVEGVAVEFYSSKTDAVIASAVSEASGRFASPLLKCLSLPPKKELRVKAQKEGFDLKEKAAAAAAPGTGLFLISATKHSSLKVSISEKTSGSPLLGVLVSLSEISAGKGTEGHRQRRLTKETGDAFFASLPPGVYSLRAILRGYAFSPLQEIQVKEGQRLPISLTATRVAFNCSGRVRVIGGDGAETDAKLQETLLTVYAVAPDGSREETPVGPSGDFQLRALKPGLHYEIGVGAPKEVQVEALDPAKRNVVMPSEDVTGLDFLVLLAPPTSLLLTIDLSEGLVALEAAGGSLLALLLPVGPERTPHPNNTQLSATEAAAAADAAGDAAGDAAAAAKEEPLRLPKGTVAVKLPLTGVALFSGVSTGDYEVAVIHTEATGGSKHLKRGSKLLQAGTGPVRVSPHSLLRVSLPPLSAAVAADPPSFDPSAPLLPPQAQQEESTGLVGLFVAAFILYFLGGQRLQKVSDWFNTSCSLMQR